MLFLVVFSLLNLHIYTKEIVMLIALHNNHYFLPFWHNPQQPKELFDPEVHSKLLINLILAGRGAQMPVTESWIWPILQGIHDINIPAMAHVSAFCGCRKDGTWHFPERVWVQITTLPKEYVDNIPLVVKDKEVLVEHLWGRDNGTYTPYDFLPDDQRNTKHSSIFWKKFFKISLREEEDDAKEKANVALWEATDVAHRYQMTPD